MDEQFFEFVRELPDPALRARAEALVGFDARYRAVAGNLRLLLERNEVRAWSVRHHGRALAVCETIAERHPLVLFEGDVGTGKTVTAECVADQMTRELRREGHLLKLSTRVRGKGLHGEMTRLLQEGFRRLHEEAGRSRLAFLLVDEADAIASTRATAQMHQEEKAAVNTLIQKLDEVRGLAGRAIVMMTTNRGDVIDPAIARRAGLRVRFERPGPEERRELLARDLGGLDLTESQVELLVEATGPRGDRLGLTWSDFRQRLLPEAVARVYPDGPLTFEVLLEVATRLIPSPALALEEE
ncbi:MAG: AAA family ATPase [Myxococcota bacterium]